MNLPKGVTVENWAAALREIEHPWREGQICGEFEFCLKHSSFESYQRVKVLSAHTVPVPAVTDELLMQMWREIWRRAQALETVHMDLTLPLDAAIILATASLEVK